MNSIRPLLSIIVPIYNVENYIEKCARSLFEQTLDDLEFIFVDDCSPDNSISILLTVLSEYPNRQKQVRIIRHQVNKGLTNARNTGLHVACGTFIAHCDSDDWVASDMYEKMCNRLIKEDADICACDMKIIYYGRTILSNNPSPTSNNKFIKEWIGQGMTPLWSLVVKKTLYDKNKITCPTHITYCEDFHITVRLLYFSQKIVRVSEPLYFYNRLNQSSLLNTSNDKAQKEEFRTYMEILDFLTIQGDSKLFEKEMAWRLLKSLQTFVFNKNHYEKFREVYNYSRRYIVSCPVYFCNHKTKIMMLLVSLKMDIIVNIINKLRNLYHTN